MEICAVNWVPAFFELISTIKTINILYYLRIKGEKNKLLSYFTDFALK